MTDAIFDQNLYFPDDGSDEWLRKLDVRLAVGMLKMFFPTSRDVLEIGVWKGGWTSSILQNVDRAVAVGIDPYPDDAGPVREELISRLEQLSLLGRFTLYGSHQEVSESARFDLVHIDGDHGEEATWNDLDFAYARTRTDAVIIVDDFANHHFPGVASALYRFSSMTDLRVFMVSPNKAYLARAERARQLYDVVLHQGLLSKELEIFRSYRELSGHPYSESSEVLGQPVLFARKKRQSAGPLRTGSRPGRAIIRQICPPLLYNAAGRLRRSF